MPRLTMVASTATTKSSGFSASSGMSKAIAPHASVAASEYRPRLAVASVIGTST